MAASKKTVSAAGKKGLRVRETAIAYVAERAERERPIKKNLRLHQSKIDEARRVLGTSTETETIEVALDLVVFRNELVAGVEAMRGAHLANVFDEDA